MPTIDAAAARVLVAEARVGRLGTVTGDGRPHLVPCCFAVVGDTVVSVVDGKPKSTGQLRRLDNIRARPAASLLVDVYSDDWTQLWWVRIDGSARVLSDEATESGPGSAEIDEYRIGVDALVEKYPQYRSERPTGALVVVSIDQINGWAFSSM